MKVSRHWQVVSFFCVIVFVINLFGCMTTAPSVKSSVTPKESKGKLSSEPEIQPYPGFVTKTMTEEGVEVILENMQREKLISRVRVDSDTKINDSIIFDVTVKNNSDGKIIVVSHNFKLITDQGEVIMGTGNMEDGFDGSFDKMKSAELYSGTKKSGKIAFVLNKTENPVKLLLEAANLGEKGGTIKLETTLP